MANAFYRILIPRWPGTGKRRTSRRTPAAVRLRRPRSTAVRRCSRLPAPWRTAPQRGDQQPERDQLDLAGLDLLAEVLGGPSDHQPADEHRQQDVEQDRVQPRSDAAEDHLIGRQVRERDRAADPGERLDRAVDGAARGDGRDDVEQRRARDPEPLFLALQVAAGGTGITLRVQAGGVLGGRAVRLGDVADRSPRRGTSPSSSRRSRTPGDGCPTSGRR